MTSSSRRQQEIVSNAQEVDSTQIAIVGNGQIVTSARDVRVQSPNIPQNNTETSSITGRSCANKHTKASSDLKLIKMDESLTPNCNSRVHSPSVNDLKGQIIEFIRPRPFLWNSTDPNYKDHKRRNKEFLEFSNDIGISVREIKRIWHVLRTNFFRAHRLLIERYPNDGRDRKEKLWKYYTAMEFILEIVDNHVDHTDNKTRNDNAGSICNEDSSSRNDSSMDTDDEDLLYARALSSTLKKFDPTTKEIIKLKFQEIIVNHMKQKD